MGTHRSHRRTWLGIFETRIASQRDTPLPKTCGDFIMRRASLRNGLALALGVTVSLVLAGPVGADDSPDSDTGPARTCVNPGDVLSADGYANRCVVVAKLDPDRQKIFTDPSGLAWVNLGFDDIPIASECVPGRVTREDGWAWECVVKDGRHRLVKKSKWRKPVIIEFAHTPSATRSNVTFSANTSLEGCRVVTSDPRLQTGQKSALSGQSTRRTMDTGKVPAGKYSLRVMCRDKRLNASADLLVRPDNSALLRSDCLDAWSDGKYGDSVPGFGRSLGTADAAKTSAECRQLAPLTADEYQRAGQEAYLKIGQIAEREVRRVSAAQGVPICQAITQVFKPVDNAGYEVAPWPHPNLDTTVPIAGYRPDGFFPILFRQWQEGPFRMDTIADCTSGIQALRLVAGTWARCDIPGMSLVLPDGHQMYPVHSFDRGGCPSSYPVNEVSQTAVCVVWGDKIGNNTVGGTGRVFETAATRASASEKPNYTADLVYDCQDRALRTGQFRDVDVKFMPTLR